MATTTTHDIYDMGRDLATRLREMKSIAPTGSHDRALDIAAHLLEISSAAKLKWAIAKLNKSQGRFQRKPKPQGNIKCQLCPGGLSDGKCGHGGGWDEDDAAAELEASTHYEASTARRLGVSVSQLRREQKEADDAQD